MGKKDGSSLKGGLQVDFRIANKGGETKNDADSLSLPFMDSG